MSDTIPDLTNLQEWNSFCEKSMTVLEVLTLLNARHRERVAEVIAERDEALEAVKAAVDDIDQTIRFVGAFVHRIRGGGRIHLEQWLKDAENRLHNAKLARKKLTPPCPADTDGDGDCGRPACPVCSIPAVAGDSPVSPGAALIAAERLRQITQEGWTPAHDDAHTRAELSGAAACYAIAANELASPRPYLNPPDISLWPWEMKWWKPGNDPVRCLVKAGALIAAEIDRLKRAEDYQRHVDTTAELCAADDSPCDACLAGGVCDGPSQEGGAS